MSRKVYNVIKSIKRFDFTDFTDFTTLRTLQTGHQAGIILIGALATMSFFMIVTLAVAEFGLSHFRSARRSLVALNALSVAEAGAERFMFEINKPGNSTYPGSGGAVELYNDSVKGRATYETSVTSGSIANEKIVTSIGSIYLPAGSAQPLVTRKVKLVITGTTPSGYAVQTGPGGLIMSNSASIGKGDVYINGYLTMSNSAVIGSNSTPARVWVAHLNCPTGGGSTYPAQCTSGQPITLNTLAHIYGEVRATNQTNGSGMTNPGLFVGSTAPPVNLPPHDREALKTAATTSRTAADASCSGNQSKTWAAGTHITGGNVSLTNNCDITVSGDVWIDGKLTLSNNSILRVAAGVTIPPTIMIDGAGSGAFTTTNSAALNANADGVGFEFITYHSAAACSPDCSDVTGNDLYNSRNILTISINNNSVAAGSSFYARWSKVSLTNGGSVGGLIGQTVEMTNSGNVTLATSGTSGDSVWDVKYYQQAFD
ncbi:MAG TPA: hypothetical protein VK963_03895 [Candidatus Saccharimonadales bacterium]|nr:hypothetical protein [Candidatus Saccharimonadales bacterium]